MALSTSEARAQSDRTTSRGERGRMSGSTYMLWNVLLFLIFWHLVKSFLVPTLVPERERMPTEVLSTNVWKLGDTAELKVFLMEEKDSTVSHQLVWHEKDLVFGSITPDQYRYKEINVPTSKHLMQNGSLGARIFLKRTNLGPFGQAKYDSISLFHPLVHYMKCYPPAASRNLLFEDSPPTQTTDADHEPIIGHWYPNVTIQWVADNASLPVKSLPPFLQAYIRSADGDCRKHFPIVYVNHFWHLKDHYFPINDSLKVLSLKLNFEPTSFWKLQLAAQFHEALRIQESIYGANTNDIKRLISETNPTLLAITMVVSLLHTIFDILAFKNDIAFWRGKSRDTLEGLSLGSIVMNAFFQGIIFLYLMDEGTNVLVLLSVGFGVLLELWKLSKAFSIYKKETFPWFVVRNQAPAIESPTRMYDQMAFKYLSCIAFPLFIGYTVYALYAESFTSWYSFILKLLVGFVYAFGFIMMTPQLFINYKLKSVAHLPWKAFMYKALNTFIDDLFAFVMHMPMLHRLACLRDDVVFVIYLIQWHLYPVDKARINEFGQCSEPGHHEKTFQEKDKDHDGLPSDYIHCEASTLPVVTSGASSVIKRRASPRFSRQRRL